MLTTEQVSFSGHNDNRTEQLYYAYQLMAACEHPTMIGSRVLPGH